MLDKGLRLKLHGVGTNLTVTRRFLLLQGPHGPFFAQLAAALRKGGHEVFRIGFNRGDQHFWRGAGFTAFLAPKSEWRDYLIDFIAVHGITDIMLYGDTRELHATAIELGQAMGLRLHVFEEGYLRPYWVTYERNGVNGYSPLMDVDIDDMREALTRWQRQRFSAPAKWGELTQHVFYGAAYHALVLMGKRRYSNYAPHRIRTIQAELRSNIIHLVKMPVKFIRRWIAQRRIKRGKFGYSLVLLQLSHDASIQTHSKFSDMISLIRLCLQEFALAAPENTHLVFKAHPLEDYFYPLAEYAFARAKELGIRDRVHFVEGGRLAELLDSAQSVVTINSTAGQQALWRGLPLKALGRAVYCKPSLVSDQPLQTFFQNPSAPNRDDYDIFRKFLLETSQIRGGFYTRFGRAALIDAVLPWILDDKSQYEKIFSNLSQVSHEMPEEQPAPKLAIAQ